MKKIEKKGHEPLIRLSKRTDIPAWKAWCIRIGSVLLGMIVCGIAAYFLIVSLKTDRKVEGGMSEYIRTHSFWKFLGEFYMSFINGSFSRWDTVMKLLKDMSILLCIALALTPAFRMRFWNIGAEGQTLVGVLAATGVNYFLGGTVNPAVRVPDPLLVPIMLAAALLAGAVWGVIPSLFKAIWNTNETLFTLMMNYVAAFLVEYCIAKWITNGSSIMPKLTSGALPVLFGQDYLLIIIIAVLLAAGMFVYLKLSKHGYEISVVGESERTAQYIGISVKSVIIRTMLLSGVLCGLTGFLIASGLDRSVTSNSVGGRGFTAIMVSWLAKFNPLMMILTAVIIAFLQLGGEAVSTSFDVSSSMPNVIIGIELFFIIGSEFFINYRVHFGKYVIGKSEGAIR